jgi:oligopeptide/dipeptide ABC transporter ATP-binding protein
MELPATSTHDQNLLEVGDLKTYFAIRGPLPVPGLRKVPRFVRAVDGVSIEVGVGETVAIVGESGCGKTTLARTILNLVKPISGSIRLDGKELPVKHRSSKDHFKATQMMFQDPGYSLDPTMRTRDTVAEPLVGLYKLTREEREKKITEVLGAVGLGREFLDRLPRQLSGGQKQRVNIARAIVTEPKLVVLDEPTSALDASVQAQILNLLLDLQKEFNLSYLIITHNISVAEYLSDRIYVMYAGKIVEHGPTKDVIKHPRHPYTITLIASAPIPDPWKRNLLNIEIKGEVPSAIDPPSGCRFHPRCKYAEEICKAQEPRLEALEPTRYAACHFVDKTAVLEAKG